MTETETCMGCHTKFEKEVGILIGSYCRNCIAIKIYEKEEQLARIREAIETFEEDDLEGLNEEDWQILGKLITLKL